MAYLAFSIPYGHPGSSVTGVDVYYSHLDVSDARRRILVEHEEVEDIAVASQSLFAPGELPFEIPVEVAPGVRPVANAEFFPFRVDTRELYGGGVNRRDAQGRLIGYTTYRARLQDYRENWIQYTFGEVSPEDYRRLPNPDRVRRGFNDAFRTGYIQTADAAAIAELGYSAVVGRPAADWERAIISLGFSLLTFTPPNPLDVAILVENGIELFLGREIGLDIAYRLPPFPISWTSGGKSNTPVSTDPLDDGPLDYDVPFPPEYYNDLESLLIAEYTPIFVTVDFKRGSRTYSEDTVTIVALAQGGSGLNSFLHFGGGGKASATPLLNESQVAIGLGAAARTGVAAIFQD